jgi:proteasome lid subunit RPN8/RPN11
MRITGLVREQLVARALNEAPHECCGFILMREEIGVLVCPVPNSARDPEHSFSMSAVEQWKAMRWARSCATTIGAIYHSHPHGMPSEPSDVDLRANPDLPQVIVSLRNWEAFKDNMVLVPETAFDVRAFRIVDGDAEEEELEVV